MDSLSEAIQCIICRRTAAEHIVSVHFIKIPLQTAQGCGTDFSYDYTHMIANGLHSNVVNTMSPTLFVFFVVFVLFCFVLFCSRDILHECL